MRQYCVAHDVIRRLVEARFARTDLPLEDEQHGALAKQLLVSTASSRGSKVRPCPGHPPGHSPATPSRPPLGRPLAAAPGFPLNSTLARPDFPLISA